MAYRHFTMPKVKKQFGLTERKVCLFPDIEDVPVSEWLQEFLDTGIPIALASSSEKAKSEFVVVPILYELRRKVGKQLAIYSGMMFDVDTEQGLNGECDFLLGKGPEQSTIEAPVITLVEAKDDVISAGLGKCIAQMMAAQLYNREEGMAVETIFGCVTTGEIWQFMKLEDKTIYMDEQHYYINEPEKILGIWSYIIDFYKDVLH